MIDRIDRKREVLVHVAKYCFEGTLEAHKEFIPLEIVPHGSQPTHRCCVYREREVLRNRVDWACGRASVYDGENHYTFTDQPVAVMNSACEGCPLQRYTVTSNCQHCMAQRCLQACRFGAITMTHQGAIINPDKCRACKLCIKTCPRTTPSPTRAVPACAPARWTRSRWIRKTAAHPSTTASASPAATAPSPARSPRFPMCR